MNKVKFISYYTKNTPYEKVIQQCLLPTLLHFKLDYHIKAIEDRGTWLQNTAYKSEFVKECLLEFKQDIVFLDSDAKVIRYPKFLFEVEDEYDLSYHELDWCYTEDTQIYTQKGWKYFYELNENEIVATMNKETRLFEWQNINKIIHKEYQGKIYNFKSGRINLSVTPEHRIIYQKDYEKKMGFDTLFESTAENIYNNNRFYIPRSCLWKGVNQEYFTLPSYYNEYGKNNNLKFHKKFVNINMKLWLKFFAWYMSEGHAEKNKVSIGQDKYFEEVKKIVQILCEKLDCKYGIYDYPNKVMNIQIFDTRLGTYLKQFGKSKEKYLPDYLKELDSDLLKLFITEYIKGDGSKNNRDKVGKIYTASEQLTKDFEEIIIKCGWNCNITKKISGFGKNIFVIRIRTNSNATIRKQHKFISNYNGSVYCVSTDNNIIYVRKNFKNPCWSGNCLQWRNHPGNRHEMLSGTMLFKYNDKVISLLDDFIAEINSNPALWEQKSMENVMKRRKDIKVKELPKEYIVIPKQDNSIPPHINKKEIVIWHEQASRKYRKRR